MKKILSLILIVATLASIVVIPASAEAKSVTQKVDVLYMSTKPTIDGVIDAAEWGEKSFTVSGANAAKPGDTSPAESNTFAWYSFKIDDNDKVNEEDTVNKEKVLGMTYDVWLRWDLDNLYIAAEVNDPDGYYLPVGMANIWNGDCLQFRVDPMGPNSYRSYKDPAYDYETQGFDVSSEATSGIEYVPWAYPTKICNIGLGTVGGSLQAYDMADQGTGNMTRAQKVNDPNKLGPNNKIFGDGKNYATEFSMKTCDENGNGKNVYECAVPWNFINQWGLGQVAVGYAWGMSMVYLNGYDDNDASTDPYQSFLTWGSGICGAQQAIGPDMSDHPEHKILRPTCGGSNAIILSAKDINGQTVEGLPECKEENGGQSGEVIHRIIDAAGSESYYLPGAVNAVEGDYTQSFDVAYIDDDTDLVEDTWVGTLLGNNYGMAAGYDAYNKKFFIGAHNMANGLNRDIPHKTSEEEFDWKKGDWHNLTIEVVDKTVTIYLDGKEVLTDTDSRYTCISDSVDYSIITYNIGDFAYDNYKITAHGKTLVDYTCDTDDAEFNKSDFQLKALPQNHPVVKGECKNANPDSRYNCLMHKAVNEEGKAVMKCDFCGTEEAASVLYGDADGNGKINTMDAIIILKAIAGWNPSGYVEANADTDGSGKVNTMDVVRLLSYIANPNNVVLGQK